MMQNHTISRLVKFQKKLLANLKKAFINYPSAIEKASKKKKNIKISKGVLHVHTSENNTIITLSDENGNKVIGNGTGNVGFKGAKENTPYAAEMLAKMPKEAARMSIVVLIVLPIACAYPFFQQYFISGLTGGAVKG